jgi:thiamine biosynthesis protein ThiS
VRVVINGEPRDMAEGITLAALIVALGARPEAVAVALNGEVVPRARLLETAVRADDRVEVIRAVGGG